MSQTETGHAKNMAGFKTLTEYVTGYGASYAPSRNELKVVNLNALYTGAVTNVTNVNTLQPQWKNAVAARHTAFETLHTLLIRIVAAVEASDAPATAVDSVLTIVRKLQGRRATPKVPATTITTTTTQSAVHQSVSVSQLSYDNIVANFDALVKLLQSFSGYSPNENDLTTASLVIVHDDLLSKNNAVVTNTVVLSNARIVRNNTLYLPETGLVFVARGVKKYVKSVYGLQSPQYQQVKAVKIYKLVKL